ncbi:hypothetical protein ACFE04_030371 [Oxalis oulophora]
MVSPSKNHLQNFSMKPSNKNSPTLHSHSHSHSSSTLTLVSKIKTLIQTILFRAFSKAKSLVDKQHILYFIYNPTRILRSKKKTAAAKILFGSFRLHYNWCNSSSHVMPVGLDYYDPSWNKNSIIYTKKQNLQCDIDHQDMNCGDISGYLQWLEGDEKGIEKEIEEREYDENEIDRLADMFIQNCHEKFRLEKVESYRKFQEMLARGI